MKNWTLKIFIITLILAGLFTALSSYLANFNFLILLIILLIVILIGIIFDMIGVAILSSKEAAFHAKASKKIKGAKASIRLVRNATKASSICNDVIGDICGIISGSLGVAIGSYLLITYGMESLLTSVIMNASISALTVGGKSLGKDIAASKCDEIVFIVGKITSIFPTK